MRPSGWILVSLLILGASRPTNVVVSPSRPTVGDLITMTFPPDVQRVFLGQGGGYEVVRSEGNRVVVRCFRPGTLSLAAQLVRKGGSSRLALNLTVHSVLAPNDAMEPAPLQPPRPLPPNRAARIAIAIAVALALSSWLAALLLMKRRSETTPERMVAPVDEFRNALVSAARTGDPNERLIQLAAATRVYLARSREELGTELTTFELVRRLPPAEARGTILELLTAADLAKFSPWGAENRDYGHLLERLARIPDTFEPRAVAA